MAFVLLGIFVPLVLQAEMFEAATAFIISLALCFAGLIAVFPFFIHWKPSAKVLAVSAVVWLAVPVAVSPLPWAVSLPYFSRLLWSLTAALLVGLWLRHTITSKGVSKQVWGLLAGIGAVLIFVTLVSLPRVSRLQESGFMRLLPDGLEDLPLSLHENELAGVLALWLPLFWITGPLIGVLSAPEQRRDLPRGWRVGSTLVALVLTPVLVLTYSRAGIGGTLAGVALIVMLALRRRRALLLGLAAVVVLFLALGGWQWLMTYFVYNGRAQGLSWSTVLTGRPRIWYSAWRAIGDMPLTGIGLGTFGHLLPLAYPVSSQVNPLLEDAHQAFLQAWLDLGLPGTLMFSGVMLATLIRLWPDREPQPGSPIRVLKLGMLGSVTAFFLYSLVDSVSPGTPAGLLVWPAFGIALGMPGRPNRRWTAFFCSRGARRFGAAAAIAVLGLLVVDKGPLNVQALRVMRGLVHDSAALQKTIEPLQELAGRDSRAWYLVGLAYHQLGQWKDRDQAWIKAFEHDPGSIRLVRAQVPENRSLAQWALTAQPGRADGYFWTAAFHERDNPELAVTLYRNGLRLDGDDGRSWLNLGRLLERQKRYQQALVAYIKSCYRGDPGANGCWNAGRMAEKLGRMDVAIRLYRHSRWPRAWQRAAKLETSSNLAGNPEHTGETKELK